MEDKSKHFQINPIWLCRMVVSNHSLFKLITLPKEIRGQNQGFKGKIEIMLHIKMCNHSYKCKPSLAGKTLLTWQTQLSPERNI